MSRGLFGAAAGAGGATVYFTGLGDSLRYVLDHGMGFSRGSGGASLASQQYDELYRMVQQLSQEMGRRQQGITIMHSNGSKSGAVYYVAVVAVGGFIYLRVFKGWKLVDMMYVTRSSLKKSVSQLSEGLDGLGQRLTSVKTYLQSQIKALTTKQDQTIAAQAAMQEHLNVVGHDVENTRAEVSEMHGTVRELEASMEQMSLSQQYANRGIYILCKVVGDMMKGPTSVKASTSAAELDNYIRHPPTIGGRIVPGLEGLLSESDGGSGTGPFARSNMEAGRLARAATESAIQSRSIPSIGALDRQASSNTDKHHGGHGGMYGGGGSNALRSTGDWVGAHASSSPRSSHSGHASRYDPDTPRSRAEEPRPQRASNAGYSSSLRRLGSSYGVPEPWDRRHSSQHGSMDSSLADIRA